MLPAQKSESDLAKEKSESDAKAATDAKLIGLTKDLAFYTEMLFIATAAFAAITVGLVVVGFLQVRDAKRTIQAATIAANVAKRQADAAVGIELPILGYKKPIFQKTVSDAVLEFTNHGRTPATISRTCMLFIVAPALHLAETELAAAALVQGASSTSRFPLVYLALFQRGAKHCCDRGRGSNRHPAGTAATRKVSPMRSTRSSEFPRMGVIRETHTGRHDGRFEAQS